MVVYILQDQQYLKFKYTLNWKIVFSSNKISTLGDSAAIHPSSSFITPENCTPKLHKLKILNWYLKKTYKAAVTSFVRFYQLLARLARVCKVGPFWAGGGGGGGRASNVWHEIVTCLQKMSSFQWQHLQLWFQVENLKWNYPWLPNLLWNQQEWLGIIKQD